MDKDKIAIPVNLDRVTKKPWVPSNTEPTPGLHSTASQPETGAQGRMDEKHFPSLIPDDRESAEYAADQIFGPSGTGK